MKFNTDVTPGVVGTALAAVAAGSLILFSLVLQESALDSPFTALTPITPNDGGASISVAAAPEQEAAGTGSSETDNASPTGSTGSDASAPATASDSLAPLTVEGGDEPIVASVDEPGDIPGASGGTGTNVGDAGNAPTADAIGPQATINKDPDGRPGDVTLPDRNGPKNTSPPHGGDPDRDGGDSRDRDEPQNDRQRASAKDKAKDKGEPRSDRQRAWAKDKATKDASKDNKNHHDKKSSDDQARGGNDQSEPSRESGDQQSDPSSGDAEPDSEQQGVEDRNDLDTRRDSDDDSPEDEDEPEDDEESHHSGDGSLGLSQGRGNRP